jgi:hypothetical protein
LSQLLEELRKRLGLRDVAREAVENEAVLRVGLRQALADHGKHGGVVDEPSGIHRRFRLPAELRRSGDGRSQQIAGRNLRDAVSLHQPLRLRALARPRRPQ